MFFDDEFDRLFNRMSRSFVSLDDLFDDVKSTGTVSGPFCYGYTMTIGPEGRPVVKEYGNVRPGLPKSNTREPLVDILVDDKEKTVKLIAEMPGVEKKDVKIVVDGKIVNIDVENGEKKYHAKVPIKQKVDENSVKASYKNGILEIIFKQLAEEKPKGKTVEVE
ncbi:MAG: Heat shock protein HSP20 [Nitrosopumilales archaeon]|nr:MAG: Heat shock protein HSP20 [Nitrosopumilales archaeon]